MKTKMHTLEQAIARITDGSLDSSDATMETVNDITMDEAVMVTTAVYIS